MILQYGKDLKGEGKKPQGSEMLKRECKGKDKNERFEGKRERKETKKRVCWLLPSAAWREGLLKNLGNSEGGSGGTPGPSPHVSCGPGRCPRAQLGAWYTCAQSLRCVRLSATPWTVAHQAPLPMGFPRQVGCHALLRGIFPTQ